MWEEVPRSLRFSVKCGVTFEAPAFEFRKPVNIMLSIININLGLLYSFHVQENSKEGRQSGWEHNRDVVGNEVSLNQCSEVLQDKITAGKPLQ